ncbi:hypothetical protein J2X68_007998 [Streptomyces sp. 3330]|uniref:hypothetical protein n=1 Tax=Streptomyces sp. 3330 TaxID=2817755 RepID=UPI002855851D|nr:hypothetical protein [Streptomyces sp. 3330]MDR6981256.1 hypothetical protein [Streptomyces sp. 3330]
MPIQDRTAGSHEEQLAIIDACISLPFPEGKGESRTDHGWSGPGYHLAVLRVTQDFWDDRSPEVVEPIERELEADLAALAETLTGRWGSPVTVDLSPYLGSDDPGDPGAEAPEPLCSLSVLAGDLLAWRVPSTGRWLGLTIGQGDRELPFELLAAVGEESSCPADAP